VRIVDLRREDRGERAAVAATVLWERGGRKGRRMDVWIAVPVDVAADLRAAPEAFLVTGALVAMYHRERRIQVEGVLDPRTVAGTTRAMALLADWWRQAPPVAIEGEVGARPRVAETTRVAAFLSGGIDSLAVVRVDRRERPASTAGAICEAWVVADGFDPFPMVPGSRYWSDLTAIAADVELPLLPVTTNLRRMEPTNTFFLRYLHGAFLAAIGHALGGRAARVRIASGGDRKHPVPWGSHEDLDPHYGGGAVEVVHDRRGGHRLEKVALVVAWPAARDRFRVCLHSAGHPAGFVNCGECEKCLRTRLELAALGALGDVGAFPRRSLDAAEIARLHIADDVAIYYEHLFEPLRTAGREDLAVAVAARLEETRRARRSMRRRLERGEHRRLGGVVRRARRAYLVWRGR